MAAGCYVVHCVQHENLRNRGRTDTLAARNARVDDRRPDAQRRNGRDFRHSDRNGEGSSSWSTSRSATKVTKGGTFDITFRTKKGNGVHYSSTAKPEAEYLQKVTKSYSWKAGGGYIKYTCIWPKKATTSYKFTSKAQNEWGTSSKVRTSRVSSAGAITASIGVDDYGFITLADDGDEEDSETSETYPEGYTPDYTGYEDGITYFSNGGIDEDGNISAFIGTAARGADSTYVYSSVEAMTAALAGQLDKVIRVEFRKGAAVNLNGLLNLNNLAEIAIDECGIEAINLSGCSALTDVALNGSKAGALDFSGCSVLKTLSLAESKNLFLLTLSSNTLLEDFTLIGSRIFELDISGIISMD